MYLFSALAFACTCPQLNPLSKCTPCPKPTSGAKTKKVNNFFIFVFLVNTHCREKSFSSPRLFGDYFIHFENIRCVKLSIHNLIPFMQKKAIIIGAGPSGLTAAYELLTRTDVIPIVLEKSGEIGGISRTTDYKGNRMDMGPHRFFSKSDRVMDWWLKMMPLEAGMAAGTTISYQNKARSIAQKASGDAQPTAAPKDPDKTMLVIQRLTRIYFL